MRVLRDFFSREERDALFPYKTAARAEAGRQGTGYEKVDALAADTLHLRERCLAALGMPTGTPHDCFVLRFPEGSFIPKHRDPAPPRSEHHRINVVLEQPSDGGELLVEGERYWLHDGDAYVFRPDLEEHEVTPVRQHYRHVFTVGALRHVEGGGQ